MPFEHTLFKSVSNESLSTMHSTSYRSEEHTSELQSQSNIVCRLLLEKKKLFRRIMSGNYFKENTMGILDRLSPSAQFIEVIEWLDDSSDTMLYRFPVRDQEIKNGAQLIVRESQAAVFVHEGQIADVFGAGRYSVEGGNTPILSKLGAWKHGFNSPIKSEVYFVNTKQFTDLKWGTSNPVMMRDTDFGMVRLRAVGIYSMRVAEPRER